MGQIDAVVKRTKSQLIAAIMNFTLLRFLISQRVPGTSSLRFTEILISHRREPYVEKNMKIFFEEKTVSCTFSMFPSLDPSARRSDWRDRTYAPASSGELQS